MERISRKIKTLEELKRIVEECKRKKKKVVHCHGVFDLVHPGHIRHLNSAKKEGDVLIVTVTADKFVNKGPGRPIFNENLRAESLGALDMVDYVSVNYAPTATNCIVLLKPDVYAKGQDYLDRSKDVTGRINEEEEAVCSAGGKIVFTQDITFSSSSIINEHLQVFPPETKAYLKGVAARYPLDYIFGQLDGLKDLKVLVIGEAIIDQYHYCVGMDKARKSNVVVYKYLSEESFAGGALAVANHVAGLCDEVTLFTLSGKEGIPRDLLHCSMRKNVNVASFATENAPTIVKRRFINDNQKLFEICYLNDALLSGSLQKKISQKLNSIIRDFDLVIVADFGHGFLERGLIQTICNRSKFLVVNTQTNGANMGFNFITQYSNIDYAALDELEIRYAAHDRRNELSKIMKEIARKIGCQTLVITRGEHGALGLEKKKILTSAPALTVNVIDSIGAGDAFLAFTAPLVARKAPQDLVMFIGNAVGALAVQIVCNREPVDPTQLKKFITTLLK